MIQDLNQVLMIKILFLEIYHIQYIQQDFQKIINQDKIQMNQIILKILSQDKT